MLPKAYRLTSREVRWVLKEGRRISSPLFSLYVDQKTPKKGYAAIVSSKVAVGSKVKRNRIRRKIYNTIEPMMESLSGGKMIISVFSDISSLSLHETREKLKILFIKSKTGNFNSQIER